MSNYLDCETQEIPSLRRNMLLPKQIEEDVVKIRILFEFHMYLAILTCILLMAIVGCLLFIIWRLFAW